MPGETLNGKQRRESPYPGWGLAAIGIVLALVAGIALGYFALPRGNEGDSALMDSQNRIEELEAQVKSLERRNEILENFVLREDALKTAINESVAASDAAERLTVGETHQALYYTVIAPESFRCADFVAIDADEEIQLVAVDEVYTCQ